MIIKKYIYRKRTVYYLTAALLTIQLTACSNDNAMDTGPSQQGRVTLTADIAGLKQTRVTETANSQSGLVSSWSDEDQLAVLPDNGFTDIVKMLKSPSGNAFEADGLSDTRISNFKSSTLYTVNDNDSDNITTSYDKETGDLKAVVNFSGQKGSVDSIARYDLMYGSCLPGKSITLSHQTCVLKFTFCSSALSKDNISRIIGSTFYYVPTTGDSTLFASKETSYFGATVKNPEINGSNTLEMTGMNIPVSSGTCTIYIAVPGRDLATSGTLRIGLTGVDLAGKTYCYNLTAAVKVMSLMCYRASVLGKTITGLTTLSSPTIGSYLFRDGSWGLLSADNAGKKPVAVVFSTTISMADAASYKHGYAMALDNAATAVQWCSPTHADETVNVPKNSFISMKGDLDGLTETKTILSSIGGLDAAKTRFRACYCAVSYKNSVKAPEYTSGWYLPGIGQLYLVVKNLGGITADPISDSGSYGNSFSWSGTGAITRINAYLAAAGGTAFDRGWYMSSSDYSISNYSHLDVNISSDIISLSSCPKYITSTAELNYNRVRSVIAF